MKTKFSYSLMLIVLLLIVSCSTTKKNEPVLSEDKKGTFWDYHLSLDERTADLISKLTLEEKMSQLRHDAPAIPRLYIPAYNWWNEALHGVARFGRATVFPQPIGMAATFDEDLIHRIGIVISDEARAKYNAAVSIGNRKQYTGLTFWSPNVNIFRDPRWGRGMETWGEDPFLTGELAGAFVDGMQGDHPKYLKTAACAKHYVVHSGPEADRHSFNAIPPQKDFYETYLPAFRKMVVEHHVEAVMCAYNRTFSEPCCGSTYLLTDILRKQWGFEGHILSDCGAINDFYRHHKVTESQAESAALALESGVDLNCGSAFKSLKAAYDQGLIAEEQVDERLTTLLKTRFKLGLFDPPSMNPYNDIKPDVVNSKKHKQLAREAAQKSIVLLKNENNTLPLSKDLKEIMVVGPLASSVDAMLGNYYGTSDEITTILEGISGKIHLGTRMDYRHAFLLDRKNLNPLSYGIGEAKRADVTIAVIGLSTLLEGEEGEALASDYKSDRKNIKLPGAQAEYLKEIAEARGEDKPLIVVITGGSPIAIPEVEEFADAILFAWYPGEQGGHAVADLIFGDVSPSGRLPMTFPKSVDQLPDYEDYSMENRTYKYMKAKPQFPFGFGLSFTSFEYSNLKLNKESVKAGESVEVNCIIKNTGNMEGEEVVQLYLKDKDASVRVPEFSLNGINRIHLKPGETKEVSFTIKPDMMEIIDENGGGTIEPGEFQVFVGGAAPVPRSIELGAPQPLKADFRVNEN